MIKHCIAITSCTKCVYFSSTHQIYHIKYLVSTQIIKKGDGTSFLKSTVNGPSKQYSSSSSFSYLYVPLNLCVVCHQEEKPFDNASVTLTVTTHGCSRCSQPSLASRTDAAAVTCATPDSPSPLQHPPLS